MYTMEELLKKAVDMNASNLHITVGIAPATRIDGEIEYIGDQKITPKDADEYVKQLLSKEEYEKYTKDGDIDISYSVRSVGRFRINIYKQRGSHAISIKPLLLQIPNFNKLVLPDVINNIIKKTTGLVIITGPACSGKTTTIASMINEINLKRSCHIITIEKPIEYLYKHKKSIVDQREVGRDCKTYADGVKAALKEDPDVILVGELNDTETIEESLTAAETGHLVIASLNTIGVSKTIDKLINVFLQYKQQYIRMQMASVIECIISQQLISRVDSKDKVCASEIMVATPAIRSLIKEGKIYQIDSVIETSEEYGMRSMNSSLIELYKKNIISYDNALLYSSDKEMMSRMVSL